MAERITDIPTLPARPAEAHKGTFGKVLIVSGSRGMVGAGALAANAALRSGAGLARIAIPGSIQLAVAQLSPCATTIAIPEDNQGMLARDSIRELLNACDGNDCVVFGPGLSQSGDLRFLTERIVLQCHLPMVIDADGLNNLAAIGRIPLHNNIILTPHPGEMLRLWQGYFREKLPDERIEQAEKLSRKSGAVVVLKGAGTVVTDGQNTYINTTGNPGMATGGSGDVLAGCIAALLARKDSTFTSLAAAILAVYIHGRAGDLAAADLTETSLIATDLIDYLPRAWGRIYTHRV